VKNGEKTNERLVKASKTSYAQMEWAREDERRKQVVDLLKEAIKNYDETPSQIRQTSLFEKMAETFG
jgi:hypothetical protein